jgi:hypothetical protein
LNRVWDELQQILVRKNSGTLFFGGFTGLPGKINIFL